MAYKMWNFWAGPDGDTCFPDRSAPVMVKVCKEMGERFVCRFRARGWGEMKRRVEAERCLLALFEDDLENELLYVAEE